MIRSYLVTASLTLSWTLSPDGLVLLGNNIGKSGIIFFVFLFVGAAISATAANLLHHPSLAAGGSPNTLKAELGSFPALTLTLTGYLSPVLLLSTGMLVTAGFTFNETFVFWFPNFGFSFLLLFFVLVLHLCGKKAVLAGQLLFFSLTAGSLLILSLGGFLVPPPVPQPAAESAAGSALTVSSLFPFLMAMLLFLGFDQPPPAETGGKRCGYFFAIGSGFLLLLLWGLVSLKHVPQTNLAESTVPYVTSAKAILGQSGRIIMGIAIISGTCGAVNGLFYLSGCALLETFSQVSRQNIARPQLFQRLQAGLTTLVITLFLASGMAGNTNLEVYIIGALLFWQLTVAAHCLAAAQRIRRRWGGKKIPALSGYLLGALFLTAVISLILIYPQSRLLGTFCLLILLASGAFAAGWCWYDRKKHNLTRQ